MQMKIVINVPMHGCKAKSKAMKIAVDIRGVVSVSLGEEGDRLVVIGEGVDSVCLVSLLRKKFCFANIVTQEEVRPTPTPAPAPASAPAPSPSAPPLPTPSRVWYEYRGYHDIEEYDPPNCSIV